MSKSLVVELLENRIRTLEKQNEALQKNNSNLVEEKRYIIEAILSKPAQKNLEKDLDYIADFCRNHERYLTRAVAIDAVENIRKVLIVLK